VDLEKIVALLDKPDRHIAAGLETTAAQFAMTAAR
jgi:hypothetical protein